MDRGEITKAERSVVLKLECAQLLLASQDRGGAQEGGTLQREARYACSSMACGDVPEGPYLHP